MATGWEKTVVSAVAMACAVMAQPAAAGDKPLQMTIVVQDYADLSEAVTTQAEIVAARVYTQIGVETTWLDAGRCAQSMPADQGAAVVHCESFIHVGLLSAAMEHQFRPDRSALGIAIPGSRVARVFVHRVEYVAHGAGQDLPDVLGHVMAHEIGHLLLGSNAHSTAGIMAAILDLPRIALGGLSFNRVQAVVIRATLDAR